MRLRTKMKNNVVQILREKKLVHPPKWLPDNIHYLAISGSVSYAVSSDTSDMDIVGFAIPPKEDIFPHLKGEIPGFGKQHQRFGQWQQHHIMDTNGAQEYDFTIYSIVKFFQLAMGNNPNILDTLFTPQRCVLVCSPIAQIMRDNRKLFLHKGSYHSMRGYAYAQLSKLTNKNKEVERKMPDSIKAITEKIDCSDLKLLGEEKQKRGLI
jgi:predicted nucleotidyltransferase